LPAFLKEHGIKKIIELESKQALANLNCQLMASHFGPNQTEALVYQKFGRAMAIIQTTRPCQNFGHALGLVMPKIW
jgi:hypothetical protein